MQQIGPVDLRKFVLGEMQQDSHQIELAVAAIAPSGVAGAVVRGWTGLIRLTIVPGGDAWQV